MLRLDPALWPENPATICHVHEFTGIFDVVIGHPLLGINLSIGTTPGFCLSSDPSMDILSPNKGALIYAYYIGDDGLTCWNIMTYWTDGTITSSWDYLYVGNDSTCYNYESGTIALRFERIGTALTFYCRMPDAAGWITLGSINNAHVTDMNYVGINTESYADNTLGFDDFQVLAGCPDAGDGALVGEAPLSIDFTDLSTGNPIAWEWYFGDGDSSDEQTPTHVYTEPGEYSVTLTVKNHAWELGKRMLSLPAYVTVTGSGVSPFGDGNDYAKYGLLYGLDFTA